MKNLKRFSLFALLAAALVLSACTLQIERNPDGSLQVESNIPAEILQAEIEAAISDPLIRDFTVDLHEGYVAVSAERARVSGDQTDTLTFRLDLGVSDGHLTATVSEVQLNGRPVEEARVAVWNERIANRLERAGRRNPDSALQAVTVTPDALKMVWCIETPRSRGG